MLKVRLGNILCVLIVSVVLKSGYAQISDGNVKKEESTKEKKEKKEKTQPEERDSLTGTNFYLSGFYQYAYRSFEDQSPYGFYSEWENQTHDFNGGFNFGLIMELNKYFHLDIGLSYFGHGENYTFNDSLTDSTYTYRNVYRQVAIPLRARFVYGDKFQIIAFAGLAPLNILSIKNTSNYNTEEGVFVERDTEIEKDGFAQFNLMLSTGIGFVYNTKYIGFTVYPEYRRHLLNVYSTKTISMDYKMFGFALNAGLILRF